MNAEAVKNNEPIFKPSIVRNTGNEVLRPKWPNQPVKGTIAFVVFTLGPEMIKPIPKNWWASVSLVTSNINANKKSCKNRLKLKERIPMCKTYPKNFSLVSYCFNISN